MADPVEIVLMPEYAADLPLWTKGGISNISSADGLGLSEQLVADLAAWQAFFEVHYGRCMWPGWLPPETAEQFIQRGHELHNRLTAELPSMLVTLNLWPTHPDAY